MVFASREDTMICSAAAIAPSVTASYLRSAPPTRPEGLQLPCPQQTAHPCIIPATSQEQLVHPRSVGCFILTGDQHGPVCRFNQNRWEKIREKVGLGDLTFHDLRKTFGSVLAQNGISTAVTQNLLEHSSPDLTNKVYTNVDPVLRYAVDQIPVADWL